MCCCFSHPPWALIFKQHLVAIIKQLFFLFFSDIPQTLLLGLKYEDLSWDFGKPPNASDDPESLPCLFIQVRMFAERLIKNHQLNGSDFFHAVPSQA